MQNQLLCNIYQLLPYAYQLFPMQSNYFTMQSSKFSRHASYFPVHTSYFSRHIYYFFVHVGYFSLTLPQALHLYMRNSLIGGWLESKQARLHAGSASFAALDALKTGSSSPCTPVLQAAMMVPELSTFVATAQVSFCLCCC